MTVSLLFKASIAWHASSDSVEHDEICKSLSIFPRRLLASMLSCAVFDHMYFHACMNARLQIRPRPSFCLSRYIYQEREVQIVRTLVSPICSSICSLLPWPYICLYADKPHRSEQTFRLTECYRMLNCDLPLD